MKTTIKTKIKTKFNSKSYNLLSFGSNTKLKKKENGKVKEYRIAGLSLMPADKVKGVNLCAMAILAGCKAPCLESAGRGSFQTVIDARTRKTELYRDNRAGFMAMLRGDIYAFIEDCKRFNVIPAIRLNVISDINFMSLIREFPEVQFYDYTKTLSRYKKDIPANYHLTFSYSGANTKYKDLFKPIWKTNYNIAVVFKGKTLPATYKGRKVINGDISDHRFLDPAGVVVGLIAKGKAKKDLSGFAIDLQTV